MLGPFLGFHRGGAPGGPPAGRVAAVLAATERARGIRTSTPRWGGAGGGAGARGGIGGTGCEGVVVIVSYRHPEVTT